MKSSMLVLSLALVVLVGCGGGGTQFAATWVNPDYQDKLVDDVLVIAVADTESGRRMWEAAMAGHLLAHGVTAYQSSQLIQKKEMLTREEIGAVIQEKGIEGVIVTRILDVNETENYVPPSTMTVSTYPSYGYPYYGSYYGYYSHGYSTVTSPGYTYTDVTVTLETNLYDASNETIVWSGQSQTFNPSNAQQDIVVPTTRMIIDELVADGLVDKK